MKTKKIWKNAQKTHTCTGRARHHPCKYHCKQYDICTRHSHFIANVHREGRESWGNVERKVRRGACKSQVRAKIWIALFWIRRSPETGWRPETKLNVYLVRYTTPSSLDGLSTGSGSLIVKSGSSWQVLNLSPVFFIFLFFSSTYFVIFLWHKKKKKKKNPLWSQLYN